MIRLAVSGLRHRWVGFAATFVAMFLCAAIMTASGALLETGIRDDAPPDRLAAAPILVAGDTHYVLPNNPLATLAERVPIDASLAPVVESVPGVAAVVLDCAVPASIIGASGRQSAAHPWSSAALTPYELVDGTAPVRSDDAVLDAGSARDAGVGVGRPVDVVVRGIVRTLRVSGIATAARDGEHGAVFLSREGFAPLVNRIGTVDMLGVLPAAGADVGHVRELVAAELAGTGVVVLSGDDRGHGESPATLEVTDLVLIGGLIGGLSLVAGLLGVASTLALSFQQRHREMALLRAVGATPAQVRRMLLGETVAVSVVATALATVPGLLLARWLFDGIVDTGLAPEGVAFRQGWVPTAVAAGVSLVASVGAALIAGRRAARTRPTEALAEADAPETPRTSRWRIGLAIACFAISGFLVHATFTLVSGPLVASPANFATIFFGVGLALVGPAVARGAVTVLAPLVRSVTGVPGYLATLGMRARVAQTAAVVTPIMLFVAIATANLYATTTESSVTSVYTEAFSGDVVLEAGPSGFAPDVVDVVRTLPGVEAASEFVTSAGFIESPTDPWQGEDLGGSQLLGLDADGAAVSSAPVADGALADLRGDSIALTVAQADALGVGVGDPISMRMGDRAARDLRVVALFEAKPSFESILLPADVLAEHTTDGRPRYILVKPAAGTSRADLEVTLAAVVVAVPGGRVTDRSALDAAFLHHLGAQALVTLLMVGMLLGYIAIQVVNNLVLSTAKRRREFALQRLTGSTRAQVLGMTAVEGALAGLIGIVIGSLVAPLTLIPFSLARAGTVIPAGQPWIYLAVVGFAAAIALGGTLLPAWLALRRPPLEVQ